MLAVLPYADLMLAATVKQLRNVISRKPFDCAKYAKDNELSKQNRQPLETIKYS